MKRYLPFIIIVFVLVAAVALAVILLRKGAGGSNLVGNQVNQSAVSENSKQASPNSASLTKPNVKVSSPVVLEEYGDYQCPPCGALYPELKKIEGEYGDQLRIVFHYFPLTRIHKNAMAAAHAAEAARLQNRFWEMHDRLYRNQRAWVDEEDPRLIFISYARELGLNLDQFQSDLDSNRVDQAISADVQRAQSLGITGTPTILIDGHQLRAEVTNPDGIRRGINVMLERKAIS
jgi:protein-disulfide isomerase